MQKTREEALGLVREFRGRLASVYGDRLRGVYLYGSYARDEAGGDSDIDVAIVLAGEVSRAEERWRIGDISSELSLREDCILTAFFMSEDEFKHSPFAIHRSISREGVLV